MDDTVTDNLVQTVDVITASNPPTTDCLNEIVTGESLYQYLVAIPTGRSARNQGFTFNRVLKVLNTRGLLPANFGQISYGLMKSQQKIQVQVIIKSLSQESSGMDLFNALRDAVVNKVEAPVSISDSDSEGGIIVNRFALMCEFYVHPESREELTRYFTKLTADERPAVLTDGIANHKKTAVTELMRICMEEVAPSVRNCFGEEWPALAAIHPENGTFPSSDIFVQRLGEVRSSWDVLKSNLSKSGTQASGIVLDSTAFDFCKYGQRTCKLHHFYMWLRWNKEDVLFLSNSLAKGVAADGNVATPYVREKLGEAGSVKLSSADRKAAKVTHAERMMGSIGKTVADAFLSLPSSSSETGSAERTAAYVAKEEQMTVAITLKRLRDTIEAPSFETFSPGTQDRIKSKYKEEVVKTLFL